MKYLGEHLLPGQIGHFFIILSLTSSLLATIAFFKAAKTPELSGRQMWLRFARISFAFETISVLAVFFVLYHIISNHYFEYKYAFTHSDKSLQVEYLLSCFWEGQEGSFMLWSFWHCVLGGILIRSAREWEPGVMTVISFAQFCLATMILGVYFFGVKVGNNPFVLVRNEGMLDGAPIFLDPVTGGLRSDYLSFLKDGTGLNALLQNYWMVIHPPILFLGFASTIVPFSFVYAGFVRKDHTWTKPVLPWAVFSGAILGLGIMMGAAWAYESLTFGGYWAWDPVENASLVPWLMLIAGLHTNLVYRHSGYSLKTTYLFYILSFTLVLYSTFLTRSGVLGDTSVHAFTGADMNTQLVLFVLVFFLPAMYLFFKRSKNIPVIRKEENTYSREFWMFIGALVLCLSALIIISKTSIPVFNKIFGTKIAPPEEAEFSYNKIQVFIALILGVLTAVTQYLKYKDTPKKVFGKKILVPTIIAVLISLVISVFGNIDYDKHGPAFLVAVHLAIFAAAYSVVANAIYIWTGAKGKLRSAGASVAHVGFGLILAGILISSSKKEVLSWNTTGITPLTTDSKENPAENITLFKGLRTDMGKYHVTYVRDTSNERNHKRYFELKFEKKDDNQTFFIYPDVIKNSKGMEGFSANPDSKHYPGKDIFVYVTSFVEGNKKDTATYQPKELKVGDTIFYSNGLMILNKVDVNPKDNARQINPGETAMMLDISVISKDGRRYGVKPGIAISGHDMRDLPDSVVSQGLVIRFNKIADEKLGKLQIGVKESNDISDLLTLKVYQFPWINILWIGVIVMVVGMILSVINRVRQGRKKI